MKQGQPITYVDSTGSHSGIVSAVVGAGPSGFKLLDVDLTDGRQYQAVPHKTDNPDIYWLQAGEPAPEPESLAEDVEEEVKRPRRRRRSA